MQAGDEGCKSSARPTGPWQKVAKTTRSFGSIRNGFPFSSTNFKLVEVPSSALVSAAVDVDLNFRASWAYGTDPDEEDAASGRVGRVAILEVEAKG